MPLLDADTSMLFLLGKGETVVKSFDLTETSPFSTLINSVIHNTPISGICLTPKPALSVMEAEVNRVLAISGEDIVTVSYIVPRKSYRDFHEDLYPDTCGFTPALSVDEWLSGKNGEVAKISLNPSAGNLVSGMNDLKVADPFPPQTEQVKPAVKATATSDAKDDPMSNQLAADVTKTTRNTPAALANLRTSSYRYITGKTLHASQHFEDIRNLNYGLSGESNVLEANAKFLAFPLSGAGGRVAVFDAAKPGRCKPVIPGIVSGSDLGDFCLSRLQCQQDLLATASDDAKIRLWRVPDGGIQSDMSVPLFALSGHTNRIHLVQFHPYVSGVLVSASIEQLGLSGASPTIRLWDIEHQKERVSLTGVADMPQSIAWRKDGSSTLVSAWKDKKIRLFDARRGSLSGTVASHDGIRSTRLFYVDDRYFVSVGFGKDSRRELNLYDMNNLSAPIATHGLDVSPSILAPHFDESSSVVYLCGKGDTGIIPVEVSPSQANEPFYPLPRFDSPGATIQQGIVFQSRKGLDVKNLEVAKCWRLTQSCVEAVSFTVPRNRREFFQDDLFPLCRDDELSTMAAEAWFNGAPDIVPPKSIDLCPTGMTRLSQAPVDNKPAPKYSFTQGERPLTDTQRQQQFLDNIYKSASHEGGSVDAPLPQDLMEGVDPEEWDD
jgi:coronin-7